MKYAAVVLRNLNHSVSSVNYACVTDALLSGGVLLDEVVLLPYDAPAAVTNSIARLARECDGVFVICDKVLLSPAREAVSVAVGTEFTGTLLETQTCLFAVLPAGERGGEPGILYAGYHEAGSHPLQPAVRAVLKPGACIHAGY